MNPVTIQPDANSLRSSLPMPPWFPQFYTSLKPVLSQSSQFILNWNTHWVMLDCTSCGLVSYQWLGSC